MLEWKKCKNDNRVYSFTWHPRVWRTLTKWSANQKLIFFELTKFELGQNMQSEIRTLKISKLTGK